MPAVARLARSRDFRSAFAAAGDRQQTIISVLPDDTVGYALGRRDEAGGVAVLVMLTPDALRIATLGPAAVGRLAADPEDDRMSVVHEDSRVDRLFSYLEQQGSVVVRRVAAQLVDHEPLPLT